MPSHGCLRAGRIALAATMLALAATGCGSSSHSSGASGGSSGTAAAATTGTAVQSAKALVAKFTAPQSPISIPALPKKPPSGERIDVLTCGFPSCQGTTAGVVAGAKALGWNVRTYTSPITPEGYSATWHQMLQTPPQGIVYTGLLPNSAIKSELAKVKKLGIPTVGIAGWDKPGPVMKAIYSGIPTLTQSGRLMGAEVVASGGGSGETAFVWDPATLMGPVKQAVTQEITSAGGTVSVLPISVANVGTQVPGQVVNYLRSHPSVKYMVFGISDFLAGVPEAIKAAGITGVKLISRSAHPNDVTDIKDGSEYMSVAEETSGSGYRAVDALARIMEHVPYQADPAGWARIVVESDATSSSVLNTPGVPSAFLHAWHVK
jgi:ribose transport system substrate-binding protein